MSKIPELIKLERENKQMKLTYNNGDNFVVSYDDLRHSCPCAKCAPLRNEDETSKSFRRQIESLPSEKPKVRTLGIMQLHRLVARVFMEFIVLKNMGTREQSRPR